MRIIFAASEVVPYAKTGGLADVAAALPKALMTLGCDISIVMPRYRTINAGQLIIDAMPVPFAGRRYCSVWFDRLGSLPVYFIDAPQYFHRSGLYGESDDVERFAFYCRAVLELCKRIGPPPDVIHCNDWMTGLIPVYLNSNYAADPYFFKTATILTIHNLAFQGLFDPSSFGLFDLDPSLLYGEKGLEFGGVASTLKGGLLHCDAITTVSRRYAQEIQTPEYGFRMDGILRYRRYSLIGILNGIDEDEWDPTSDKYLPAHYSIVNLAGKAICKRELLKTFNLPIELDRPLLAIVSRMTDQKGFDLIIKAMDRILETKAMLVVLGSGADKYERYFQALRDSHPDRVGVYFGFNNPLAHQIEAGADIFLMPSYYEPCGLNQMYSLRYGTVPIVRATGGLDDTVENFDRARMRGNGFKFYDYDVNQFVERVYEALLTYADKDVWHQLIINGMSQDFSWASSARKYLDVYHAVRRD
ncbi:MAG: glycogen synthase GlgA [Acidobacteriota bacterium]|nr:glycogen synthase GlgA [Blastocatellia bacterium]MDW8412816.1 glycogen synthase GlgA [Acidobacteriota bacterium]